MTYKYLFIFVFICLSASLSLYLSVYLSISLSIYPSIYLSIYLAIYLSTLRELILAGTYFRGFHFFEISRKKWELIFADFRDFILNENFAETYFRG